MNCISITTISFCTPKILNVTQPRPSSYAKSHRDRPNSIFLNGLGKKCTTQPFTITKVQTFLLINKLVVHVVTSVGIAPNISA